MGCPGGSDGNESACSAQDLDSIPGSGRPPGERNGYPLQCSCLKNSMDRGAWQAHGGHKESDTTEQLTYTYTRCDMFIFLQILPNGFPKWLYQLTHHGL